MVDVERRRRTSINGARLSESDRFSAVSTVAETDLGPGSNVIAFPKRIDGPQAGEGDGGDGTEIVVRIVVDWPDRPQDPTSEREPEPERNGGLGPFLWGALIGW